MVVLDSRGMLTNGSNQYLQPDYLSPLPTTLDAKKSPLALLAQTCSQIGADSSSGNNKSFDKPKKDALSLAANGGSAAERAPSAKSDRVASRGSPLSATEITRTTPKLAFKPYENIPVSKPLPEKPAEISEPGKKSPGSKSNRKSPSAKPSKDKEGASPIIRSGLELLQGVKEPLGSPYKSLPVNPYLEVNPAFRPPTLAGFPPGFAYMQPFYRKDAQVCKDPYCQGCQLSAHNAQLLAAVAAAAPCPAGCTQCDHHKYGLAAALSLMQPSMPQSLAALYPPPPPAGSTPRPYICSWIVGDNYCGKRFNSSDELLQHLRSHTAAAAPADLLSPHSLMRYPNPPLSPMSAARYHPYAKPGALPPSLAAGPFSAFNPPPLSAYYPPFSFYGPRVGSSAVHP
ncbi:zinc finger protein Noc [Neocloeon triangulifer]|uniref:zinc finger protein Noc n=1 Tax=Neocloeon triangulifer TaxID=2078957 RepID=UPI00286F5E18|nr:zinc finger protein Noc [Neocloeon triangulifer]